MNANTSTPTCAVVDYGIGNVFSVTQALRKLGADVVLTGDPARILAADRVILPGVGAFGRAAERLRTLGLDGVLVRYVETGRPFLGICVGMQLLLARGLEFGEHKGLGLFDGSVEKVDITDKDGRAQRVPLIGWFPIETPEARQDGLADQVLDSGGTGAAYYFVHSYAARPADPEAARAIVRHGDHAITAAIGRDNVLGVQFHPERSGAHGLALLNRFLGT